MLPVEHVQIIQAQPVSLEMQTRLSLFFGVHEVEWCREVEWTSSALGFPEKGKMYCHVMVPGYELVVRTPEGRFRVHTNRDGTQILARLENM